MARRSRGAINVKFAIMGRILQYKASGVQTLLRGFLRGLSEISHEHEIVLFVDLHQSLPASLNTRQIQIEPISPKTNFSIGRFFWDHIAVGRACRHLEIDALYAPAHVRPAYAPCPVVVMVPDMMYHRFPEYWDWSDQTYFRIAVSTLTSRATRIVALSQSTKRDILSYLSIPEEKIEVVYPGVPQGFEPLPPRVSKKIRSEYNLRRPFILFVGSFHPRKNLNGLLDAFEEIADRCPHDLIIAGSRWDNEKIKQRIQESPVAQRIRSVGFVPDGDLPLFYNEADLFVYPSLFEGFGFPVLEALACGCPTITTNVSSLPEAAGNAAFLVQPGNTRMLGDAIYQMLTDSDQKVQLQKRALEQAQRFSWTKSASAILDLLEAAALEAPEAGKKEKLIAESPRTPGKTSTP